MSTLDDINALRLRGWSWTRIGAHYRVSEREVIRWVAKGTTPPRVPAPPTQLSWRTGMVVNDLQFPYHDPALWEVTCQIARDAEVDHLIWDGDILDFPQLSRFVHNPYLLNKASEDVEEFHTQCRDPFLAAVPTLETEDWNDGNHEWRYERYQMSSGPALDGAYPEPKQFLRLPDEVNYQPYGAGIGTVLCNDSLLINHGWIARMHSAYTAKGTAEQIGSMSAVIGHTHRVGVYQRTTPVGTQKVYEVGHMSDERLVPKAKPGVQNWQQTAGTILKYRTDGTAFSVHINEVINGKYILVGDREYTVCR